MGFDLSIVGQRDTVAAELMKSVSLDDLNNVSEADAAAEGSFLVKGAADWGPKTLADLGLPSYSAMKLFNVASYGASPGNADNTVQIQAACYAAQAAGGGVVWLPPGGAYKVSNLVLGNGVMLAGVRSSNFPGATAPNAQWTASGSWLQPTDPALPGVKLQGHGSCIAGINFIYDQPTPTGGTYTPNSYGPAIEVASVHSLIADIIVVNGTHGIFLTYTAGSGGGTGVRLHNLLLSCMLTAFKTSNVNDTVYMNNFHARPLWQNGANLWDVYANAVAWDCGYTDNIIVNGFEAVFLKRGIFFRNQTCLGNTHSLYNGQLSGVQLSLCRKAMECEAATTVITGQIADLLVQQGNAFGITWADEAFSLGSDGLDLSVASLKIPEAGGQIGSFGAGLGGRLRIADLLVAKYSSAAAGQTGFAIAANFKLELGPCNITKIAGAGARFAGAGADAGVRTAAMRLACAPYGRFGEVDYTSASATYVDVGTSCELRPGLASIHQVRVIAEWNVVTPQTGNLNFRFSGLAEAIVTPQSVATSGWKTFDTGWVDIAQSSLDGLSIIGRPQLNIPVGCRVTNGSVCVLVR